MNIKTNLRVGICYGNAWLGRILQEVDGYHGDVFGKDGRIHSFSPDYTEFIPNYEARFPGETVIFTIYPAGSPFEGKVSCISHKS